DTDSPKIEFERLTSIRTIRGILEYLEESLGNSDEAKPDAPTSADAASDEEALKKNDPSPAAPDIQRGLLELMDAPLPGGGSMLIPSGAVLLTDDGRGVAAEVAHRLADFGHETIVIRHRRSPQAQDGDGVFYGDPPDEASVVELDTRIR